MFAYCYRIIIITICLALFSGCAWILTPNVESNVEQFKPGTYQLDPEHTSVLFKVGHLGLSTYVGRFNRFEAQLDFLPEDIASSRLNARVFISSIDVNNTDLSETLLDDDWFDVVVYPTAELETLAFIQNEDNSFTMQTNLTIKGITKKVNFNARFNGAANNILTGYYTLGFTALGSINRSDFNLDTAIPMVSDNVAIEIYAEFQKR